MKTEIKEKIKKEPTVKKEHSLNKTWLGICAVLLVVSIVVGLMPCVNSTSIDIAIHTDAIALGKNPDGTPFNIYEVLSDQVLSDAAKKLGIEDVEDFKNHLIVKDNTTAQNVKDTKQNIKDGTNSQSYVPSGYTLTYEVICEEAKEQGIFSLCGEYFGQIFNPSKKEILAAVAESYAKYYNRKYILNAETLKPDWSKTDLLDYYNKAEGLMSNANRVNRFIRGRYDENAAYTAQSTDYGYGDLSLQLSQVMDVDIENFKSFIIQNGLTEDKEALINQFTFMREKNIEENLRKTKEYAVNTKAIEMYDPNVTKVVFIPALDTENSFYMNRTKVGVDYLVEQANNALLAADETEHNAKNYAYLITQFSNASTPDEALFEEADRMYASIKAKIDEITEKTVETVDEEAEKEEFMNPEIVNLRSDFSFISWAIVSAKTFIMLLLVVFVVYSISEIIKNRKVRRA